MEEEYYGKGKLYTACFRKAKYFIWKINSNVYVHIPIRISSWHLMKVFFGFKFQALNVEWCIHYICLMFFLVNLFVVFFQWNFIMFFLVKLF